MSAHIDLAPTARARCRGCGAPIQKGARRVGDTFASPFADDRQTTHWYHPRCAAYKRPEVLLLALEGDGGCRDDGEDPGLLAAAREGIAHRRLPRIDGAERAPSGRATCRACRQKIDARSWRIRLAIFDTGRFAPAGFVHASCAAGYFECAELLARVRHFAPALGDNDAAELQLALATAAP